jgi:hypothetical protein
MHKILPSRHHAFLALQISIVRYRGNTKPGKWVIDSAQSFLALSWICESEQVPTDFDGAIPWESLGGDVILRNTGLSVSRFVAGNITGHYFSSAIIPIRESEWQIN